MKIYCYTKSFLTVMGYMPANIKVQGGREEDNRKLAGTENSIQ